MKTPLRSKNKINPGGVIRIKKDKDNPFFTAGKAAFRDARLRWDSKGVLAYLLTHDNNVSFQDLINQGPARQTKIRSALKDLQKWGYIIRKKVRQQNGQFLWETWVWEEPGEFFETPKPKTPNPLTIKEKEESTISRFTTKGFLPIEKTLNKEYNNINKEYNNIKSFLKKKRLCVSPSQTPSGPFLDETQEFSEKHSFLESKENSPPGKKQEIDFLFLKQNFSDPAALKEVVVANTIRLSTEYFQSFDSENIGDTFVKDPIGFIRPPLFVEETRIQVPELIVSLPPVLSKKQSKKSRSPGLHKGQEKKKNLPPLKNIHPDVIRIISHWNSLDGISTMRIDNEKPSQVYSDVVQALDKLLIGKFFFPIQGYGEKNRAFSPREVLQSINNFHIAATSPDHYPVKKKDLKKLSLLLFLYNPHWENGEKSSFLKFLSGLPKEIIQPISDDNPGETERLIYWFKKKIHGNGNIEISFSQAQLNNFVLAREKLDKFYKSHTLMLRDVDQEMEWFLDALITKVKQIGPHTLSQDWAINQCLFNFLTERQIIYSEGAMTRPQKRWDRQEEAKKNGNGWKLKPEVQEMKEEEGEEDFYVPVRPQDPIRAKKKEIPVDEYGDPIERLKEPILSTNPILERRAKEKGK